MVQPDNHWLILKITETDGEGVEVSKLARLLERVSAAFYAIARTKVGPPQAGRRGPRTTAEDALAGVRLVRVSPGSTTIEFAPPAASLQIGLPEADLVTPDGLVSDFLDEIDQIEAGQDVRPDGWEFRRRVQEVVEQAGQIGARGELLYQPLSTADGGKVRTLHFRTREIPPSAPPQRSSRSRRLVGHAFMVDVEPGRQRIRLKMSDGRDVTLEVDENLLTSIPGALDRVVELQVDEQVEGSVTTSRTVRSLSVLPSSAPGSDRPPKSIAQLAEEQELPSERPDYVAIASTVWVTEEDIRKFDEHVASMRTAEAG